MEDASTEQWGDEGLKDRPEAPGPDHAPQHGRTWQGVRRQGQQPQRHEHTPTDEMQEHAPGTAEVLQGCALQGMARHQRDHPLHEHDCVFRAKVAIDSTPNLPLIP